VNELLELKLDDRISDYLDQMRQDGLLMVRELKNPEGATESCYYSKSLYFDELYVAKRISNIKTPLIVNRKRVENWINRYCKAKNLSLSDEQADALRHSV